MDGINEILRAEAEAAEIRKAAAAEAAALLDAAELYRSEALEKARRQGDQEARRLYEAAEQRAARRLEELADLLEFGDLLKRPVGKLSGGQRRRIDIARALLHKPRILILDEPTTGLDPQTRHNLWQVIARLRREQGLTVLLTTHYMEEAAALSDRIGILKNGRLLAAGTAEELMQRAGTDDFETTFVSIVKEGAL